MTPRIPFVITRPAALAALACLLSAGGAAAQSATMTDLLRDIGQVEQKLVGLARAMPADKYDWRPGEGVRSVGEVFQHVAADNYLLSAATGAAAPAATGIRAEDYNTAVAYENRELDRDAIIAELQASFAHVKKAMSATTDARLGESVSVFGGQMTVRQLWVVEVGHIHEHLGQSIAYARTNGVVPPWSR